MNIDLYYTDVPGIYVTEDGYFVNEDGDIFDGDGDLIEEEALDVYNEGRIASDIDRRTNGRYGDALVTAGGAGAGLAAGAAAGGRIGKYVGMRSNKNYAKVRRIADIYKNAPRKGPGVTNTIKRDVARRDFRQMMGKYGKGIRQSASKGRINGKYLGAAAGIAAGSVAAHKAYNYLKKKNESVDIMTDYDGMA